MEMKNGKGAAQERGTAVEVPIMSAEREVAVEAVGIEMADIEQRTSASGANGCNGGSSDGRSSDSGVPMLQPMLGVPMLGGTMLGVPMLQQGAPAPARLKFGGKPMKIETVTLSGGLKMFEARSAHSSRIAEAHLCWLRGR
eukprot:gene8944-12781_t